jgi:threonine/homoserine/homoserine lactone efflux protein
MPGIHDLWLFVVSGILFNMAPGPDVFYVVSRSAGHGARGGAVAALGICAGSFVHIGAAAIGLSAMLAASATAFTVVKLIGAAYLVYTGVRMLASLGKGKESRKDSGQGETSFGSIFAQGFLTNALNPKVALFFLAFLPQFIDHDAPNKALAFASLGLILNLTGTSWNMFLAWSTSRVAAKFGRGGKVGAVFSRCAGGLFVLLGIRLALADNS